MRLWWRRGLCAVYGWRFYSLEILEGIGAESNTSAGRAYAEDEPLVETLASDVFHAANEPAFDYANLITDLWPSASSVVHVTPPR